jgi:hypothetical protein
MKRYVVAVEALRKIGRWGETQFTTKIDGFLVPSSLWMLMFFFVQVFFWSHPVYDQTQCSDVIFYFTNNFAIFLLYTFNDHTFLQIHIN